MTLIEIFTDEGRFEAPLRLPECFDYCCPRTWPSALCFCPSAQFAYPAHLRPPNQRVVMKGLLGSVLWTSRYAQGGLVIPNSSSILLTIHPNTWIRNKDLCSNSRAKYFRLIANGSYILRICFFRNTKFARAFVIH